MTIGKARRPTGRLDGTGATIIYVATNWGKRKPKKKEISKWAKRRLKRKLKKKQLKKIDPLLQNYTLCKHYESRTGKCHNVKCELLFPTCEGSCIYWEGNRKDLIGAKKKDKPTKIKKPRPKPQERYSYVSSPTINGKRTVYFTWNEDTKK